MKTNTIFLLLIIFALAEIQAQITWSINPSTGIHNFDGSYDDFGTNHLFYPNGGEIRYGNRDHNSAISEVKYYTMNTNPKQFLLSNNCISLCYYKGNAIINTSAPPDSSHRIDIEWDRRNSGVFLARVDTQNFARLNYFTEWFATSGGRTDVRGAASIVCQSIYPNTDLVYTSNNAGLVMYFVVYPGGNYNNIFLHVKGSKANSIVSNKLKIEANWDATTFEKPQMYQYAINGSVVTPIAVGNADWQSAGVDLYKITSSSTYNTNLPLIIQLRQANPLNVQTAGLKWSTYFGGSQFDFLTKTHCDANDNLYIGGYSNSPGTFFPQGQGGAQITNNNGDGVIAKFNTTGVLQWSTFVGGSSTDEIHDFDFRGDTVYCVGKTASSNLLYKHKVGASTDSTFGGPNWDGFIFQFKFQQNTGAIQSQWLTYYGGNGDDELNGVKFDAAGNMFVVGASASTNLSPFGPSGSYQQAFNSAQLSQVSPPVSTDGIIAKFNAGTSLNSWFSFYGTDSLGANANSYSADYFYCLTINGTHVYACGKAGGTNLPKRINSKFVNGDFDGILARFTTSGFMATGDAKFTNGNICNYSVKVLLDSVYTVGQADNTLVTTNSGAYYFNGTASGNSDGCFSVHSKDLSTTIHNSFLGGNGDDAAYDIQTTSNNLILISGGTNSSNFPTFNLSGPYNDTGTPINGTWLNDNFIACLAIANTNLVWSTYLGSEWNESNWFPVIMNTGNYPSITTMAVTSADGLYVLGVSNSYTSFPRNQWYGFPTYFQGSQSGAQTVGSTCDGTITRIDMTALGETTGLKDFRNTKFVFGFFPNPTSKVLSINNKDIVNEDLRYAIYDIGGKKLQEGYLKSGDKKEIDVSFLSEGVYVINVSDGKMTYSNKFIKSND